MSDHANKIDSLEKSMRQLEQNLQKNERKTDKFINDIGQSIKKNNEKMDMIISQLKDIRKDSKAFDQRLWDLRDQISNNYDMFSNNQRKNNDIQIAFYEKWDRRFYASQEELKKSRDKYESKFQRINERISKILEQTNKDIQVLRDNQESITELLQKQQKPKIPFLSLINNCVGKSLTSLSKSASSLFSSLKQCLSSLNKPKEKLQMAQEQVGELLSPSQESHAQPKTSLIGLPLSNEKKQE